MKPPLQIPKAGSSPCSPAARRSRARAGRRGRTAWAFALSLALCVLLSHQAGAVNKTWTNGGGDGLWHTAANWSPSGVPGSADAAIFGSGTGASSASCTINSAVSVTSISVGGAYTGQISQGSYTITLGGNFTVAAASQFNGGTGLVIANGTGHNLNTAAPLYDLEIANNTTIITGQAVTISHNLILTSVGSMYSNGDRPLLVGGDLIVNDVNGWTTPGGFSAVAVALNGSGDQTVSGTNGMLSLFRVVKSTGTAFLQDDLTVSSFAGSATANVGSAGGKLKLTGGQWAFDGTIDYAEINAATVSVNATPTITNTLTITAVDHLQTSNGHALFVTGNVAISDADGWTTPSGFGNVFVVLNGTGNQTFTGTGGTVSYLNISKTAGSVQLNTDLNVNKSFAGTSSVPITGSGVLKFGGASFTYGGTIENIEIYGNNNISFNATLNVTGNLTITGVNQINTNGANSRISVRGNVVSNDADGWTNGSGYSAVTMVLNGTGNQNLSGTGIIPRIEVIKTSGQVSFTGTSVSNGFTYFVVPSGEFNMGGGSISCSSGFLAPGGLISGSGTINGAVSISSGGGLKPGNASGCMTINGNLSMNGGTFHQSVAGSTPCSQFRRLIVNGTVSLLNASLSGTSAAQASGEMVFIENDGTDAVSAAFGGLSNGSTLSWNGHNYWIYYTGGTGNDVTLVGPYITAPSSVSFGSAGVCASSVTQTISISSSTLIPASGTIAVSAPAGFQVSTDGTTWAGSLSISYTGSALNTTLYARFSPAASGAASGTLSVSGGSASAAVALDGTGTGVPAITGTASTCAGSTSQLANAASGGTWSSSHPSVATVSSTGLVSAIAAGTTTISYTLPCGTNAATAAFIVDPSYTVSASAGPNGAISPAGSTTVCPGGNLSYTITADPGYHIQDVLVDGLSAGPLSAYSFSNVSANGHTISALFAPDCMAPAIACPASVTQPVSAGQCTAIVNYSAATATGTAPVVTYSQNSGTAFSIGVTTVTATATNACGTASCNFDVTVLSPEVEVVGNNQLIPDGSSTTGAADYTDFGAGPVSRTFTIRNTGAAPLSIGSISFTGAHAGEFALTAGPAGTVAAHASAAFTVTFTPAAPGVRTAVLHIANGDCDETDYDFAVQGTGIAATALDFDGVDDYVDLGTSFGNFGTSDFTLETRFKTTQGTNANIAIISKRASCVHSNFWNLSIANGKPFLEIDQSNTNYSVTPSTQSYNDGQWHHVAATRKGSVLRLYVDGNLVATGSTGGVTNLSNTASVKLAQSPCGNFNGSLDEVRIWSRALCQSEIQSSMSCELPAGQTGLVAYYKLNNGVVGGNNAGVTTTADASGNGHTGTLYKSANAGFALSGASSNWTAGNVSGACASFTPPVPAITSVTPAGAAPGATVTIAGSNFEYSGTVVIGSTPMVVSSYTNTSITAVLPAGICGGDIAVTNACGAASGGSAYAISNTPVITAVSPAGAPANTNVTIAGSGFMSSGSVTIGGMPMTIVSYSATSIVATMPMGVCSTSPIVVTNSCNTSSAPSSYAVTPFVTSITATGNTTFCPGGSVLLTAGSGASYLWSTNATTASVTVAAGGTYSVTVTDASGCSDTRSATVTVLPNYTVAASPGANGSISPAGSSSVCGGGSAVYTITASAGYHVDDVLVDGNSVGALTTYTFSNVTANHTISASFAPDCIAPAISCPASMTVPADAGLCSALVTYSAATATGTTPAISYSQNPGTAFSTGITTVTATATNACGTASCSFTVTVEDRQDPTITAPADITMNGYCMPVAVALGTPVTADNCGVASVTSNAPAAFPVGTTNVVWMVTDIHGRTATATQTVTVNAGAITATAAVAPLYPFPGQEIQTIYLGYSPSAQSETISVTPSGGASPYSYSWTRSGCNNTTMSSLSHTTDSYTFSPPASIICRSDSDNVFIFTVNITDARGCATTQTRRINVVDPYVGNKIRICHRPPGDPTNTQILHVSVNALATHLDHGDDIGNCFEFKGRIVKQNEERTIQVIPNPSTGVFKVVLSTIKAGADIRITDVQGKVISRKLIEKDMIPEAMFDLSQFSAGMYLIQVQDGDVSHRAKVVLQ